MDVAGADAQLHHHRRVAGLGQLEALLHHAHHRGQVGARIHQPHRRLHGEGVRPLLDDAGAFAVILAEDDHGAAHHAGRREIRERVRGDVGTDHGFPRHRAAQGIVDRRAEHRGGRGLAGARLQVHAEVRHQVLGIDQDVDQMRDGRALIAADIGDAGLQQGLGDRDDTFAVEGFTLAQL